MATKLGLYNAALRELGNRGIASLTEDNPARRALDDVYDAVLADCLEAGQWNFAIRTSKFDYDTGTTPAFGYQYVFGKPSDWVRTTALSESEYLEPSLPRYYDDVNYWSADVTPIYARYVSNSTDWGLSLTLWPATFRRYVELELAVRVCEVVTSGSSMKTRLEQDRDKARRNAMNKDAMNEAQPRYFPMGSWNGSRRIGADNRKRGGL